MTADRLPGRFKGLGTVVPGTDSGLLSIGGLLLTVVSLLLVCVLQRRRCEVIGNCSTCLNANLSTFKSISPYDFPQHSL